MTSSVSYRITWLLFVMCAIECYHMPAFILFFKQISGDCSQRRIHVQALYSPNGFFFLLSNLEENHSVVFVGAFCFFYSHSPDARSNSVVFDGLLLLWLFLVPLLLCNLLIRSNWAHLLFSPITVSVISPAICLLDPEHKMWPPPPPFCVFDRDYSVTALKWNRTPCQPCTGW